MTGPADEHPDLSGTEMGRYRLGQRIGQGGTSSVYLAHDPTLQEPVAVKVLHDLQRVQVRESEIQRVAALQHQHIVQVHEYGTSETGTSYLALSVAEGGTLKEVIARTPVDLSRALEILRALASALDAAHEQGVLHQDVKPSNVLFTDGRSPLLADFAISRISYGLVGTPGYMAPERIAREPVDRRADVYGLAALAFEMLTGSRLYPDGSPADVLLSTVEAPVPLASERRPALPRLLDTVLLRALAKDPGERYAVAGEFSDDLAGAAAGARVVRGVGQEPAARGEPADPAPAVPAVPAVPEAADPPATDALFEQSVAKLMEILDLALTASVMVDETSFVVGWNELAEREFGWSRDEILGRSLVTTVIPPRYREAHERGLRHYLETGEGPVFGVKLQLAALHRDGRELPIELSISEAVRSGGKARILAFMRDRSAETRVQQARQVSAEVDRVLEREPALAAAAPALLEAIGGGLGWSAGFFWSPDPEAGALRCLHHWQAPDTTFAAFVEAVSAATFAPGEGLPGRAWSGDEPAWVEDFVARADPTRALAAARAGLRSAIAIPVLQGRGAGAVLEFFSAEARSEDDDLLDRMSVIGRRIGRHYRAGTPEPPETPGED